MGLFVNVCLSVNMIDVSIMAKRLWKSGSPEPVDRSNQSQCHRIGRAKSEFRHLPSQDPNVIGQWAPRTGCVHRQPYSENRQAYSENRPPYSENIPLTPSRYRYQAEMDWVISGCGTEVSLYQPITMIPPYLINIHTELSACSTIEQTTNFQSRTERFTPDGGSCVPVS